MTNMEEAIVLYSLFSSAGVRAGIRTSWGVVNAVVQCKLLMQLLKRYVISKKVALLA